MGMRFDLLPIAIELDDGQIVAWAKLAPPRESHGLSSEPSMVPHFLLSIERKRSGRYCDTKPGRYSPGYSRKMCPLPSGRRLSNANRRRGPDLRLRTKTETVCTGPWHAP